MIMETRLNRFIRAAILCTELWLGHHKVASKRKNPVTVLLQCAHFEIPGL